MEFGFSVFVCLLSGTGFPFQIRFELFLLSLLLFSDLNAWSASYSAQEMKIYVCKTLTLTVKVNHMSNISVPNKSLYDLKFFQANHVTSHNYRKTIAVKHDLSLARDSRPIADAPSAT